MRKSSTRTSAAFVEQRCRATYRLRERAREAEGYARFWLEWAARVLELTRERLSEMRARTEEAEDAERDLRRAVRDERAALTRFIESPEWERDLYVMLRHRLRAAQLGYRWKHRACEACGGFGQDFYDVAFIDEIRALESEHGLEPADTALRRGATHYADPLHWPRVLGTVPRRWDEDEAGGPRVGYL